MPDRSGSRAWQRMLSGRRLDLIDPSPLDVEIEDIAQGLSRVARWNGQTVGDHAYSVAQHSLNVLDIFVAQNPDASLRDRLATLLHDAPEYVIGDMISPFKVVMGGNYKDVEDRLQRAVNLRFGLPAATPANLKRAIKKADLVSAFFEATLVAGFADPEAAQFFGRPRGLTRAVSNFEPMASVDAQKAFLEAFTKLDGAASKAAQ